ncbi:MAG: Eco29kI family restriction endonuclease [Armatimonadetes bacterium]|nr:Eco29kI family restriction endonuclease [Armatimonadota bacterium]
MRGPARPLHRRRRVCNLLRGSFPSYERLAAQNRDDRFGAPIYIGKAIPAGARKGGLGLDVDAGQVLQRRLSEHAESIRQADNLKLEDFSCRFLVVEDIWIPLAESMLIERFRPMWNVMIDGFGNHDPGRGRRRQRRSQWDELHPGRPWARQLLEQMPEQSERVREQLAAYNAGERDADLDAATEAGLTVDRG